MKNKNLSTVEYTLLQIIREKEEISGYDIKKVVEQRQYKNWTDIGNTSIYKGLKKIEEKKLVESRFDIKKQGKGPVPVKFYLTEQGLKEFEYLTIQFLSNTRERDRRFDLALAGCSYLSKEQVINALKIRIDYLKEAEKNIEKRYMEQGGDKLNSFVQALFEHPLALITAEINFIKELINNILKENKNAKN